MQHDQTRKSLERNVVVTAWWLGLSRERAGQTRAEDGAIEMAHSIRAGRKPSMVAGRAVGRASPVHGGTYHRDPGFSECSLTRTGCAARFRFWPRRLATRSDSPPGNGGLPFVRRPLRAV